MSLRVLFGVSASPYRCPLPFSSIFCRSLGIAQSLALTLHSTLTHIKGVSHPNSCPRIAPHVNSCSLGSWHSTDIYSYKPVYPLSLWATNYFLQWVNGCARAIAARRLVLHGPHLASLCYSIEVDVPCWPFFQQYAVVKSTKPLKQFGSQITWKIGPQNEKQSFVFLRKVTVTVAVWPVSRLLRSLFAGTISRILHSYSTVYRYSVKSCRGRHTTSIENGKVFVASRKVLYHKDAHRSATELQFFNIVLGHHAELCPLRLIAYLWDQHFLKKWIALLKSTAYTSIFVICPVYCIPCARTWRTPTCTRAVNPVYQWQQSGGALHDAAPISLSLHSNNKQFSGSCTLYGSSPTLTRCSVGPVGHHIFCSPSSVLVHSFWTGKWFSKRWNIGQELHLSRIARRVRAVNR